MPSVPYPKLRSEPVRYLIVTIVDYSRVPVSLAWLLSLLALVLALTKLGRIFGIGRHRLAHQSWGQPGIG